MSTGEEIAAVVNAGTAILGLGAQIYNAAKEQAEAVDEAAADAAREKRRQALMHMAKETQRQLLEFELDK